MWRLLNTFKESLRPRFEKLYGDRNLDRLLERLALIAGRYSYLEKSCSAETPCWDEKSCLLITYGDMITANGEAPLATLRRFLNDYLAGIITGVHVLPFFPYSSDDGFSVIDYRKVDQQLGSWDDINLLAEDFRLMVDLVVNHVSSRSRWFQDYIGSIAPARDYFVEMEQETDLSMVVRPRTSPLLTPVYTVYGERFVWTTFSSDQVDLNFANPDVLLEMIDILLGYISHGAAIIRLDAIAYLWKEINTSCINLPQTHEVVKLLRDVMNNVTPGVVLLTETNLPHEENISYFGNGDEAHLVYQFSLPPLILHTIHSGSARHLRTWASEQAPPPDGCSFLNFTASHDGIGVRPLEGLLAEEEIDWLVATIRTCGGFVSSRAGEDGRELPYELNITYFDGMKDTDRPDDLSWQSLRFLCSQIIMLSLRGIPAIYFHSLTASRNNHEGVAETGENRTINRGRWQDGELRNLLENPETTTARVFTSYTDLLTKRAQHPAFHPDTPQKIIETVDSFFVVLRTPQDGKPITCLHNVTGHKQQVQLSELGSAFAGRDSAWDIIAEEEVGETLELEPYQCCWLR
ncbi:MAG: alpha-amylase [Desulfobulbaceae bacterium]|nr:alpha-amylase [Desulfobulbaceae bacterium]